MGVVALIVVGLAAWVKFGWTTEYAYVTIVESKPTGVVPVCGHFSLAFWLSASPWWSGSGSDFMLKRVAA